MKKIITIILFSLSALTYSQVTNGIIGHWPLDANANDIVGTNNGTVVGAQLTTDRDGNAASAYAFDVGQYIQLGDAAEFDFGAQPFTIAAWVQKTQNASGWNNTLIGKWNTGGAPGTNELLLTLSSSAPNNKPYFAVEVGTSKYSVISTVELNLNQWHHITAVRRAAVIEIYIDGAIAGITGIPNQAVVNNVGRNLEIARFRDDIYLQNGAIDDVKIFDRDLSHTEIAQLFNDTNPVAICTNLYAVDGNIGIGTQITNGYKLAVKGKIIAEELKVQVFPWADFVFEDDYELPTLAEVAQHIKEKGHLEHIPSAAEVTKNGINVGEMDAKLLRKIEELMLYTIAQDKELKQQEYLISKLELRLKKSK